MTTPSAQQHLQTPPASESRRGKHRKGKRALTVHPSAREPARQQPAPARQCISCRKSRPQPQLLELSAGPVAAVLGGGQAAKPGRATYVCVARACLLQLGQTLQPGAGEQLLVDIEALARARFVGMVGLCRRQGALLVGAGRLADPKNDVEGLLIYAASDLAARTLRQLQHLGEVTSLPLDAASLSQAVGQTNVGAVGILPGRLGLRAAYWLHVWYEATRPGGPSSEQQHPGCAPPSKPCNSRLNDGRIEVAR